VLFKILRFTDYGPSALIGFRLSFVSCRFFFSARALSLAARLRRVGIRRAGTVFKAIKRRVNRSNAVCLF